jgi:preprotein translocase subunit SecG
MYTILLVIHSIIVLFLIALVLVQRTDSDGMGGLGGGGGNQFLTGRTQANLLTRTTAILAAAFFVTSLTLAVMASRMTSGSIIDATPISQSVPLDNNAAAPAPEAPKSAPVEKTTPSVPKPE